MDTEISEQIRDYVEAAAPAIPLTELAERRTAASRPERRTSGRIWAVPRRVAAATVVAATVAAAGAAAIGVAESGGSRARPAHAAIRLTAAMVHRVEKASAAALASAGHVFVTYSIPEPPGIVPRVSGTIDFTFSGHDFNAVSWMPKSLSGAGRLKLTIRVVNGQIYIFGTPGRPLQWQHFSNQTERGRALPDPRALLQALRPEADFEAVGSQLIGGVRTEHLRATKLRDLPASLMSSLAFVSSMGPQQLAALDVWVDSHDVVREMRITFSSHGPQGRLAQVQTVRFLDVGKPETITAPAHYVNQATRR